MTWADEARKRCEAAVPGPWIQGDLYVPFLQGWIQRLHPDDQEFIVHSKTDLPFALAMLEEADRIFGTLICDRGDYDRDIVESWLSRYAAGPKAEA